MIAKHFEKLGCGIQVLYSKYFMFRKCILWHFGNLASRAHEHNGDGISPFHMIHPLRQSWALKLYLASVDI